MRRPALIAAALASTAAAPTPADAQHILGTRDARAHRADSVFQRFDRTDSPGCALGVYQDGKIRYARGYGMASLEHGIAISPRTVLDVGSISKQFTAMAALILEKDGKLSLDDPIRKYIPEMPAYADRITVRRALSQTSGLRDLYTLMSQTGRVFAGDSIDALRIITRSAEPNYEPGERYLYTNSGWILVAQAIYRLTGKTLAQFAEERIFAPLGMHDTRYMSDASLVIPNVAESYSPRASGGWQLARSSYDGAIMGAGGVHTTIEDFGRWLDNYDAAAVGGRDAIATLTTPTKLNDGLPARSGTTTAYAVGLNAGTVRGLPAVQHGGSWAGFRGHFIRFPEQRFAVATFCNLSTSGPDSLARKVAGIYLGDRMHADSATLWTVSLAGAPRADVPATDMRRLTGVWRNLARGEVRRTRLSGDTLVSVAGARTALVPLGGGRFRGTSGTEIRFEGDGPAPSRMFVRTAGDTVTFLRVDTAVVTLAKLAEYAGEYRSDEVEATHVWKVEKGELVRYINDRRNGTLEPTYADGFLRGGAVIDMTRDSRGRITGYVVQAGRVRNLRFTRVRSAPGG
jgi:CubicO group peptidase (beta-lactamase class C family)